MALQPAGPGMKVTIISGLAGAGRTQNRMENCCSGCCRLGVVVLPLNQPEEYHRLLYAWSHYRCRFNDPARHSRMPLPCRYMTLPCQYWDSTSNNHVTIYFIQKPPPSPYMEVKRLHTDPTRPELAPTLSRLPNQSVEASPAPPSTIEKQEEYHKIEI